MARVTGLEPATSGVTGLKIILDFQGMFQLLNPANVLQESLKLKLRLALAILVSRRLGGAAYNDQATSSTLSRKALYRWLG